VGMGGGGHSCVFEGVVGSICVGSERGFVGLICRLPTKMRVKGGGCCQGRGRV
jgi:hypothetical protein